METDNNEPCYRWRYCEEYVCGSTPEFYPYKHQVPFFLTLHAHIVIETTLESVARKFIPKLFSKIINLFYDVVHGFVSSHNMKEILNWWKERCMEDDLYNNAN